MNVWLGLGLILLAAWVLVAFVLALLIFPLPAAEPGERCLAWKMVLGWPITLAIVVCTSSRDDWRTL